jgi:ligand-binding SRPBCC domain-containing protein
MTSPLQCTSQVIIDAPLEKVWAFNMDITQLERYHPRTDVVTYLTGQTTREVGAEYQCNVLEGPDKGSCVERITEIIPLKQFTTTIPRDTWGISSLFENFEAVTRFDVLDGHTTRMSICSDFDTNTEESRKFLPEARTKFEEQAKEVLEAIKNMIESEINH